MIFIATVYMHTVISNGKKYIGQCNGDPKLRWGSKGHRYKTQFFYYAINKYGWENIKHETIAENLSQEDADKLEKQLILKYKTYEKEYGYNIEMGGKSGYWVNGAKVHNAKQVVCIETGEIWGCANDCARDLNVNCASLQESLYNGYRCKGKHYKYVDDKTYIAKNPHSVICIETGQIWKTVQECAADIGVTPRTVRRYCSGERKCPHETTYKYYVA